MRAHSQTMDQRPRVGVMVDVGGLDWFQRLRQWFKGLSPRRREIGPVSPYGTWDAQHERFRPLRAEAALDIVAAQGGVSWSSQIYNTSL